MMYHCAGNKHGVNCDASSWNQFTDKEGSYSDNGQCDRCWNIERSLETARAYWAKIAKENGWYAEPFFVQIWLNQDGTTEDSVSHKDMTSDVILGNK